MAGQRPDGGGVCAAGRRSSGFSKTIDGYVVIANINSDKQAVIGGASPAVEQAVAAFLKAGYNAVPLPVSHAFHTSIVAPASEPLRAGAGAPAPPAAARADRRQRQRRVLSHGPGRADGHAGHPGAADRVARAVRQRPAHALRRRRARLRGSRAQEGAARIRRGRARRTHDVLALFTNHPKFDDAAAFNQALCGLYAAGLGSRAQPKRRRTPVRLPAEQPRSRRPGGDHRRVPGTARWPSASSTTPTSPASCAASNSSTSFPTRFRRAMLDKHITRLVKSDNGEPTFEDDPQPGGCDQAGGARRRVRSGEGVRRSGRARRGARPRRPDWPSRPESTPCAMPESP